MPLDRKERHWDTKEQTVHHPDTLNVELDTAVG